MYKLYLFYINFIKIIFYQFLRTDEKYPEQCNSIAALRVLDIFLSDNPLFNF